MQIIMEARPGQNNTFNSHLEQNYFSVPLRNILCIWNYFYICMINIIKLPRIMFLFKVIICS